MRLVFSTDATADLDEILSYSVEKWGASRELGYVTEIRNRAMQLVDGFHPGVPADEIATGLRRQVAGSHVIWFRREADRLLIIRVLHQSRDAGRWMGGEG